MAQLRKIIVSLPDSLLKEVDLLVSADHKSRSEFVREAMKLYIKERKKIELYEKMRKGYKEMAKINLEIAENCLEVDNEIQNWYEEKLSECE